MATIASFSSMLSRYLSSDPLRQELMRGDRLLDLIPRMDAWQGGTFTLPDYESMEHRVIYDELGGYPEGFWPPRIPPGQSVAEILAAVEKMPRR